MRYTQKLAAVCAAALPFALIGCATTPTTETTSDTLKVVASTTQICDYLTQIAQAGITVDKTDAQGKHNTIGDGAVEMDLTCLLAPNASAHEHEMTPQQMKALGAADILFINGVDLEHFLDSAVTTSGFDGEVSVTSGVGEIPGDAFTIDKGTEAIDVRPWPFVEEGEEAEFSHDPHVWTAPPLAAIQVKNIGRALAKAAPDKADTFTKAVDAYTQKLADLDAWAKKSLDTVPVEKRTLFTSHDAFGYLAAAYDITFIGAALSDFNHQQDATAEHIQAAADEVKKSGATVLFAENSNNDKSISAIARAAGVTAITDADALYGDSLGPAGSPGETYIGSIVHNVTTLVEAWGGKPAELPTSLK